MFQSADVCAYTSGMFETRMRCVRCWLLVALGFEYVTGSMEHDPCAGFHDCTAAVELGMPPAIHTPEYDDSDQMLLIQDGKAFLMDQLSPPTTMPINLRAQLAL